VRVSACGVWCWQAGRVIWDDYLDHRQFVLVEGAERLLSWFAEWRDGQSIRSLGDATFNSAAYERITDTLLGGDILIQEGSARHARETAVLFSWSAWGPLARAFHYATRTDAEARFLDPGQQRQQFEERQATTKPPLAVIEAALAQRIALPPASDEIFLRRDVLEVLRRRRSRRHFGAGPLPLAAFGALLEVGAGITGFDETTATVFKVSPSGGGRHPTEVYAYVRNVAGLEPSVYRYDASEHAVIRVGELPTAEDVIAACGDQRWIGDAPVVLCYTSAFGRNAWKYDSPRSYRVLLLDVGHLSQTLSIVATALDLNATFTAALRDELIEQHLHIDSATELVMGCMAVGPG
jgi:SagB-type dehydrogenase family enzyme